MLGVEDKVKLFEQLLQMFEKKMAGDVKSKINIAKGLGSDSPSAESDSLVGVIKVSDKDKADKVVLDIAENDAEINPALAAYKKKISSKKSKSSKAK